ncbi:ubiquinol-cytochrome C chaperone family protein [Sphingomonas sp.]|uniref:ubiquinol-cytochrome C chaperone family protein n=1 Tax=Sphingomonas sp. TaxID=28214 RepID=UPI000DAFA9F7|nr:ubiquinol-cytochrome C chaperone family protein [Sphingomonas sp.]PZU10937.1 MAG: ubiquinol-cytochrome C chaperone [Sphingomonas sp.]
MGRDAGRDALVPLYRAIVSAARLPVWYRAGKVPDTIDGRFDMIATILTLVLLRLESEGAQANAAAARLTETFVDDMDGQLRQEGIGDIVVGKHVGRMMGALGGRLGAFRDALAPGGDLDGAIARNVLRDPDADRGAVAVLRDGFLSLNAELEATPVNELLEGAWRS